MHATREETPRPFYPRDAVPESSACSSALRPTPYDVCMYVCRVCICTQFSTASVGDEAPPPFATYRSAYLRM